MAERKVCKCMEDIRNAYKIQFGIPQAFDTKSKQNVSQNIIQWCRNFPVGQDMDPWRILWEQQWKIWFHNRQRISWPEQLLKNDSAKGAGRVKELITSFHNNLAFSADAVITSSPLRKDSFIICRAYLSAVSSSCPNKLRVRKVWKQSGQVGGSSVNKLPSGAYTQLPDVATFHHPH